MQGRSRTARALSRNFVAEGITTYTHVSDQHSTFGTQVIVSTERDATCTLDEILGNTTELPIVEHTADTHGQTPGHLRPVRSGGAAAVAPDRQAHRDAALAPLSGGRYARWSHVGPLLEHHAQTELIDEHRDDLLRIGGSPQALMTAAG
jgi:Tn3 transposase DDE domain